MKTAPMTKAKANLELAIWRGEAEAVSNCDLYIWLTDCGLPPEVALRLRDLISFTARVGEKVIDLGKVILIKLIEFVKKHPNMAIGVALGAAFSALIAAIPILGHVLAPIALPLGIFVGGVAGHRIDKANGQQMNSDTGLITIAQEVIEIAREFFQLFIDTISAVTSELTC